MIGAVKTPPASSVGCACCADVLNISTSVDKADGEMKDSADMQTL